MSESESKIDACEFLFLSDIQELGGNRLRLVVHEGKPTGKPQTINVGSTNLHDCTPIAVTPESASFEIKWPSYIAYAVLNESYAGQPDTKQLYTGKRFRVYSKSHFMENVSRSTFATDEYPGPMIHTEICCEDQIVNVVSVVSPTIAVTDPPGRPATATLPKFEP